MLMTYVPFPDPIAIVTTPISCDRSKSSPALSSPHASTASCRLWSISSATLWNTISSLLSVFTPRRCSTKPADSDWAGIQSHTREVDIRSRRVNASTDEAAPDAIGANRVERGAARRPAPRARLDNKRRDIGSAGGPKNVR